MSNKAELSQISNPNLLDNWYFADPINQRGCIEYTELGYTIDRWFVSTDGAASVEVGENGVLFTKTSGSYADFRQKLEPELLNVLVSEGGMLSILIDEELYNVKVKDEHSAFPGGYLFFTEGSVFARLSENKTILITAAKLELGNKQTLAHQTSDGGWILNDPPPNKALELTKCQRYYQVLGGRATGHLKFFGIPIPTTFRARPTLSLKTGGIVKFPDGQEYSVTGIQELIKIYNNMLDVNVNLSGSNGAAGTCDWTDFILEANAEL